MSSWGTFASCETLDMCRLDQACDLYGECALLGEGGAQAVTPLPPEPASPQQ